MKFFKLASAILGLCLLFNTASATIGGTGGGSGGSIGTTGVFWVNDSGEIQYKDATWELGGTTNRIPGTAWFNDINSTTATIGGFVGVILASDGTEGAPSISFTNDSDTGFFSANTNADLGITAGGTNRLQVAGATGTVELKTTTAQLLLPISDVAATPTLAFGDGDTGFYETADDTLRVATNGTAKYEWTGNSFSGIAADSALFRNDGATSTNPTIVPSKSDTDSGLGWTSADRLSIVSGGVSAMEFYEDTTVQAIVPLQNDATKPSIAFGDGDSGWFESSDDAIKLSLAGTGAYEFSANKFYGNAGGSASVLNAVASSTAPTFLPSKEDTDTGLGWTSADRLSLIAGATELLRLVEDTENYVEVAENNMWLKWRDNAGTGTINGIKINASDELEFGTAINIGAINLSDDSGAITLVDMGVTATPASGTEESYTFAVDSNNILTIGAEADSSGGIQNPQVVIGKGSVIGSGANPSLAFGDGDTGFYESADDTISFSTDSTSRVTISSIGLRITDNERPIIRNVNATATVPNVVSRSGDNDTGIGSNGDDQLSLIAGGEEGMRFVQDTWGTSFHIPEITTPTAIADYGAIYTKADNRLYFQDGEGDEHTLAQTDTNYAGMYWDDNSNATTIETASTPILIRETTTGDLNGWTYDAGSTGAITAFSDGTGKVNVASATHGLVSGDIISIRGTTNYNGVWEVTLIDAGNFSIADTWVADDGASDWDEGAYILAGSGATGEYAMTYSISATVGASDKLITSIYVNENACPKCRTSIQFANNDQWNLVGQALVPVTAGDRITLSITSDGTASVTVQYGNLFMHRL